MTPSGVLMLLLGWAVGAVVTGLILTYLIARFDTLSDENVGRIITFSLLWCIFVPIVTVVVPPAALFYWAASKGKEHKSSR